MTKVVFLTFDDGPSKGTEIVREVLKSNGDKASFFLTGSNAATAGGKSQQKKITLDLIADGHRLGNHCFRHIPATKAEYESEYGPNDTPMNSGQKKKFNSNYDENQTYFRELLAQAKFQFDVARLPGDGRTFSKLVQATHDLGMKHYSWSFEFAPNGVFGWVPHDDWQSVSGVAASHADLPPNNSNILLHGNHWKDKKTEFAALIKKLKDENYSFKVVPN